MEQNTNANKGNAKRVINGVVHYYDYKNVMMKREIYTELKRQAYISDMSIPAYIKTLLERNK